VVGGRPTIVLAWWSSDGQTATTPKEEPMEPKRACFAFSTWLLRGGGGEGENEMMALKKRDERRNAKSARPRTHNPRARNDFIRSSPTHSLCPCQWWLR